MEESDVCIVMLDATRGMEGQDMTIIGQAIKAKKGVVIMVNKWDAVEKDHKTADVWRKEFLKRLAPIDYLPIIFASVHETADRFAHVCVLLQPAAVHQRILRALSRKQTARTLRLRWRTTDVVFQAEIGRWMLDIGLLLVQRPGSNVQQPASLFVLPRS